MSIKDEMSKFSEIAAQAATIAAINAVELHQRDEKVFWDETRKRLEAIEGQQTGMRQAMETFRLAKLGASVLGWLALIGAAVMTIWSGLHWNGK